MLYSVTFISQTTRAFQVDAPKTSNRRAISLVKNKEELQSQSGSVSVREGWVIRLQEADERFVVCPVLTGCSSIQKRCVRSLQSTSLCSDWGHLNKSKFWPALLWHHISEIVMTGGMGKHQVVSSLSRGIEEKRIKQKKIAVEEPQKEKMSLEPAETEDEGMWKPCRASEVQPRSLETGGPAAYVSAHMSCLCVRTDQQLGDSAGVSMTDRPLPVWLNISIQPNKHTSTNTTALAPAPV